MQGAEDLPEVVHGREVAQRPCSSPETVRACRQLQSQAQQHCGYASKGLRPQVNHARSSVHT